MAAGHELWGRWSRLWARNPSRSQLLDVRHGRASANGWITELDLSPVIARADDAVAVDARVRIRPAQPADAYVRHPLRMDYPAEIKRGRAFADQAEQMARRWEQARSASTCPRRSRRSAPRSPPAGVELSQPAAAPHSGE